MPLCFHQALQCALVTVFHYQIHEVQRFASVNEAHNMRMVQLPQQIYLLKQRIRNLKFGIDRNLLHGKEGVWISASFGIVTKID